MLPTDQALPLLWNWESEESFDDDSFRQGPPPETFFWLREDGGKWLREDGGGWLLEAAP